jgi:hypothetical protein
MSKIEVNQISSQCGSTLTIGQSGDTVTLACGATQTGFGRTGTVDWCTTAKTAPFTGVSGKGYFVNTTCGAVTVTLPATPSAGDIISIKDYAKTAGTNNINFCRNGSKMDGDCASGSITTDGESTTLIYVDGTKGWTSILDSTTNTYGAAFITATGGTITCCGDYKIHTFTSSGTFTVCSVGNPAGSDSVSYVVVAGGGGAMGGYTGCVSSYRTSSGGGGAGGYREGKVSGDPYTASPIAAATGIPVSVQGYPITIGGGGSGGVSNSGGATQGSSSIFSTITSAGGGIGRNGGDLGTVPEHFGGPGGSGGGAGGFNPCTAICGGVGNTPPTSPPQGNDGGKATNGGFTSAGGGGGATAVGLDGGLLPTSPLFPATQGGIGGAGATSSISGSPTARAGGGGGASGYNLQPGTPSPGGAGGGGTGNGNGCNGVPGSTNTGGGGGGTSGYSGPNDGGAGGSGIVIIRYKFQ